MDMMVNSKQDEMEVQRFEPPLVIEPSVTQAVGSINSALILLHLASKTVTTLPPMEQYDIREDFKWFTSGELDTSSFKGKYIAIWKRQVVASGDDATEVENVAKGYCGQDSRPAIVFIPETEEAIL